MSKIWFITGSSRGLGRALTEAVLRHGDRVAASARSPESLAELTAEYGDGVLPLRLNVTDAAEASAAIDAAVKAFGRIDVLVNNAGYGYVGAFEEQSAEAFRAQIDTNFWGVVNVTRAALPVFRAQRAGHIIQISSIGGRMAFPGSSGYHAAKFAVEGFRETLALEVAPLGIHVTIIEPGGFRTDYAGASMSYADPIADYAPVLADMRNFMQTHAAEAIPGDPNKAAEVMIGVTEMEKPPLRLPLGNDAALLLRRSYETSLAELKRWEELTRSTDSADVARGALEAIAALTPKERNE